MSNQMKDRLIEWTALLGAALFLQLVTGCIGYGLYSLWRLAQ